MMLNIKNTIRKSKIFYRIYSFFGMGINLFFKTINLKQKKQIMFISYGGEKIDDSPYYIYLSMLDDEFFLDYTFLWAVTSNADTSFINDSRTKLISSVSLTYFYHLYKSNIWITNTSVSRGLNIYKPNGVIYINTWHGTPFKTIGHDAQQNVFSSDVGRKGVAKAIFLVQSEYEKKVFRKAFGTLVDSIAHTGLPRNDVLLREKDTSNFRKTKHKLGINTNLPILIYSPTFRDNDSSLYLPEIKDMIEQLCKNYFVLYRGHHASNDRTTMEQLSNANFLNVSNYPILNDLLMISDVMVTDYSSICIDFAILDKPIYFWLYDLEEYSNSRGLYIDLPSVFGDGVYLEKDKLVKSLEATNDYEIGFLNCEIIKDMFLEELGNGTRNSITLIKSKLLERDQNE